MKGHSGILFWRPSSEQPTAELECQHGTKQRHDLAIFITYLILLLIGINYNSNGAVTGDDVDAINEIS